MQETLTSTFLLNTPHYLSCILIFLHRAILQYRQTIKSLKFPWLKINDFSKNLGVQTYMQTNKLFFFHSKFEFRKKIIFPENLAVQTNIFKAAKLAAAF